MGMSGMEMEMEGKDLKNRALVDKDYIQQLSQQKRL